MPDKPQIRMAICDDRKTVRCVDLASEDKVACPILGTRKTAVAAHGYTSEPESFDGHDGYPSLVDSLHSQAYDVLRLDWEHSARFTRPTMFDNCQDLKMLKEIIQEWYVPAGGKNKCGKFENVCSYQNAVKRAPNAAMEIAAIIAHIKRHNRDSFIHLLGSSLGAHVVGQAGRRVQQEQSKSVDRITGLDPAKPLFYKAGEDANSLTKDDAKFVDIIHTNPACFGAPDKAGHVDIYVKDVIKPGNQTTVSKQEKLSFMDVTKCLIGKNTKCFLRQTDKHGLATDVFIASIGLCSTRPAPITTSLNDKHVLPTNPLRAIGFGTDDAFWKWFQTQNKTSTPIDVFVEVDRGCPTQGVYRKRRPAGIGRSFNEVNPWDFLNAKFGSK